MRTSTRRAEAAPAEARLTTVLYHTADGDGSLTLRGDLPWELTLPGRHVDREPLEPREAPPAAAAWASLLERYFAGERVEFPLDVAAFTAARGCTAFEADVLAALAQVPYGETISYRGLAAAAGRPAAQRAAGSVMARNPLPVILPCHRVVRSDGSLGNYVDDPRWKSRLLRLEGALPGTQSPRGETRS